MQSGKVPQRRRWANQKYHLGFLLAVGLVGSAPRVRAAPTEETPLVLGDCQAAFPAEAVQTFAPESQPVRAVALVMHGLNTRPSRMNDLALALSGRGALAMRGALAGHRGEPQGWEGVSRKVWLQEFSSLYCLARQEALARQVPLFLVAYSLGALIALDFIAESPEHGAAFSKLALLAPALAPTRLLSALDLVAWWPSLTIPSLSPKDYRANGGTSVGAYLAMRDSHRHWRNHPDQRVLQPTLMITHPKDELVRLEELESEGIQRRFASLESLHFEREDGPKGSLPMHLIIDQEAMSAASWQALVGAITGFLGL